MDQTFFYYYSDERGGGSSGPTSPPVPGNITSTAYGSTTDTTLGIPTGIANGNVLLATIFTFGLFPDAAPVPTPPAGFAAVGTPISVFDGQGNNGSVSMFRKKALNESGSYVFAHSPCNNQGLMQSFSNCSPSGSPIGNISLNNGSGLTTTGTGITALSQHSLLLFNAINWEAPGNLLPPTGMTEVFDSLLYAAYETLVASGATGDRVQTPNGNIGIEPWAVFMIELLAAP